MTPDDPLPYMERTRAWYLALGYGNPYRYAHFSEVPFQPLRKPLADCVLTLVTTAAPYQPDKGPQGPGAPYNAAAKFFQLYSGNGNQQLGSSMDVCLRSIATCAMRRSWSRALSPL